MKREIIEKVMLTIPYGEHLEAVKELESVGFKVRISYARQDGKFYVYLADRTLESTTKIKEKVDLTKEYKWPNTKSFRLAGTTQPE